MELDGGKQAGREGARKDGVWDGGSKGRVGEGGSKGREWGSDDVREGGARVEEGNEWGRNVCMDGARERGGSNGEEQGRSVGGIEMGGGKLQGRYPGDIGQYTAYTTTHNAALVIATLALQMQNCKRVYKLCIVMRSNVLFDRWVKWFYVMAIMDCVHMTW